MSPPRAGLTFSILGSLQVVRDGRRIEPEAPKVRTLLLDLLVHRGESRSTDRLIDDLWGEHPPGTAVGILQNYVSQLRKLLGADVVRRAGNGYHLDVGADQVDAGRFTALATSARSALADGDPDTAVSRAVEALGLWRGEALADVATAEFARAERVRLRELRAATLEFRFEAQLAVGDDRVAVPELEAALADEPLRERLWWLLMTALHRGGRQAEALAAYQRARRVLVDELGIEPGHELRELEQAVLRQRTDAAATTRRRTFPTPQPALYGRAHEMAVIEEFLTRGRGVLALTGEPGIGKTRLLEQAQDRSPWIAVAGRAYEAERGRPYGPWVDALRSVPLPTLPEQVRDGLAALLPELSEEVAGLDDASRLYDAVVALLHRLADISPVMVVLDDLHWLDERSTALLHYVVRQCAGTVPFIGSARPHELAENRACHRTLDALRRADLAQVLAVGPLPDDSTIALVRRMAPRADPSEIVRASNGNPLFALEMARAVARGDDPLSGHVDALIGDRLARLSEQGAALVPWLAAFGRSIKPAVLAAAMDRALADLLEPLEDLEARGIVVAGPDGSYDFGHDLVRDAAYRRMSVPRRILLHGRLGRALLVVPDPDDTLAAAAAWHADRGGDSLTCATASIRAARRCVRVLAYEEAADHVARGRDHASSLEPRERVVLDVQLVDILLHPGLRLRDSADLATELVELCALAEQLGMPAELTAALTLLARVYHWGWGDVPRARAVMQRALDVTTVEDESAAEPLLQGARCLAYLEIDMPRTQQLFDQLEGLGSLAEASYQYQWGRGLVHAWAGAAPAARAALAQAVQLAGARGDHWAQFECAARLAVLELEEGHPAIEVSAQLGPMAARLGPGGSEPAYAAAISALAALSNADAGRAELAELAERLDELRRIDARFLMPDLLCIAAEQLYRRGDLASSERYAAQALDTAVEVHRPGEAARAHGLLACMAAARGDADGADRHLAAVGAQEQCPHHVTRLREEAQTLMMSVPKEATWP